MEKYLDAPIKEIIGKFPEVGKLLEEYNISCVPCALGSCLLKDVVVIHNLPKDQELELIYRIGKTIYPERDIKKPALKPMIVKEARREIKYSPPLKKLVDEHALIKKWIDLVPAMIESIDIESNLSRQLILDGLDFIRLYADKFHHAKEEEILFEYTDKNLDIIKTVLADHEAARAHVRAVSEAIKGKNRDAVIEHLCAYGDLLVEHIKKEDKVLYPWIDRNLSTTQVGELFARFNEVEENMDKEMEKRCKRIVREIEQRIRQLKTKKEAIK